MTLAEQKHNFTGGKRVIKLPGKSHFNAKNKEFFLQNSLRSIIQSFKTPATDNNLISMC